MASTVTELLRRRFGGKRDEGYIKNGLVFYLDGINKGTADPDKWVDLVGGLIFSNDGAVNGTNCWQFNNTSSTYYVLKNTDTLSFSIDTHTIEVCFNSNKNDGLIFAPRGVSQISFGFYSYYSGNSITWSSMTSIHTWYSATKCIGAHTISVSKTNALKDYSTALSKDVQDYWRATNYNYNGIGGRSTNATYQFNGKIYAIRIYNRQLSIDEMAHNQKVDNERFNLGLNI